MIHYFVRKKKALSTQKLGKQGSYLNCIADLVVAAIRERSFVPQVSTPAADGVVTGFDVLSVGDDLCATVFGFINIAKCPGVFERCAGGLAADGGGIITVRIEWRIEIDKIDAIAIHPSHNV